MQPESLALAYRKTYSLERSRFNIGHGLNPWHFLLFLIHNTVKFIQVSLHVIGTCAGARFRNGWM
jgi:hypothetical protein